MILRKVISILLFVFITSSAAFSISTTIDPLDIGVGTRSLGMGKAFVAAADDVNSIFLNPAGLANTHDWGLTSNYSTHFEEITYMTLGAFRATSQESFGIGYVGANIGGDLFITYRDPTSHRIVPGDIVAAGYSSNVVLLSYGVLLGKYYNFPFSDKLSFGTSIKLFFQTIKSTDEISATGQDIDVGLIYKHNDWLRFGLYGQNVLPTTFSGLLIWSGGAQEDIPANYKLGISFKAFGENAYSSYPQDVYFNLDFENGFEENRPTIFHLGAEWWPYKYLALRAGVDQDLYTKIAGNGIDNNVTFGLGLWSGDFGFDYAYHQYGPLIDNTTHYFSISYGFPWAGTAPKPVPAQPLMVKPEQPPRVIESPTKEAPAEFLIITEPDDRSYIYTDIVSVNGDINRQGVGKVVVNSVEAVVLKEGLAETGPFSASLIIPKLGKYPIAIDCYDSQESIIKEYKIRLLRIPSFLDVKEGYWAKNNITAVSTLGYLGGYADGTFRPNSPITRAEMTAMLVRAMDVELPSISKDLFKDVDKKYWAARYIKVGVDRGIITGYRNGTFKPAGTITRAEGTVMIAKFAGLIPPKTVVEKPFPDITPNHWAAKWISAAKQEGQLSYLAGKPFEPNAVMTKIDAIEILSRTKLVSQKIKTLFDWESGY
jgi:hypothetical protein